MIRRVVCYLVLHSPLFPCPCNIARNIASPRLAPPRPASPRLVMVGKKNREMPFVEHFVRLMRTHPLIWHKGHKDYKSSVERSLAWNAIEQSMVATFGYVRLASVPGLNLDSVAGMKAKWRNLVSTYLRLRRLAKKREAAAASEGEDESKPVSLWPYYNLMHFIENPDTCEDGGEEEGGYVDEDLGPPPDSGVGEDAHANDSVDVKNQLNFVHYADETSASEETPSDVGAGHPNIVEVHPVISHFTDPNDLSANALPPPPRPPTFTSQSHHAVFPSGNQLPFTTTTSTSTMQLSRNCLNNSLSQHDLKQNKEPLPPDLRKLGSFSSIRSRKRARIGSSTPGQGAWRRRDWLSFQQACEALAGAANNAAAASTASAALAAVKEDEDTLFSKLLAAQMRKLPLSKKIDMRVHFLNKVTEVRLAEEQKWNGIKASEGGRDSRGAGGQVSVSDDLGCSKHIPVKEKTGSPDCMGDGGAGTRKDKGRPVKTGANTNNWQNGQLNSNSSPAEISRSRKEEKNKH